MIIATIAKVSNRCALDLGYWIGTINRNDGINYYSANVKLVLIEVAIY